MHVDQQVGFCQLQFSGFRIQVGGVGAYIHHIGNEHVVRAEGDDFLYPALDAQGRFLDERGADNGTFAGCQLHLLEFVVVLARTYAAPVGGARHILGCQVNDKLHVALDDVVGVTFRPHGNVAHGRVCTNGSRPCNGQYVIFFRGASAAHQYGGQRINHGSRFPVFFHQIISMSSLVCSFSQ